MAGTFLKPSLRGGAELRRTAAALRAAGRTDLYREVSKAVKAEAQPTLRDVQASARHAQITGRRAGGKPFTAHTRPKHLRDRMAAATGVEFRASGRESRVSFRVNSGRMGDARVLPRYTDLGTAWRHPIMGRRRRWAESKGKPWFFDPIKKDLPKIRDRISIALDGITERIERT